MSHNIEFIKGRRGTGCDWMSWIGSPMLYDGSWFATKGDVLHPWDERQIKIALVEEYTPAHQVFTPPLNFSEEYPNPQFS